MRTQQKLQIGEDRTKVQENVSKGWPRWRGEEETINMNIIIFWRGIPGSEISPTNTRMQPPALRPIGAVEGWEGKGVENNVCLCVHFLIGFLFWEAPSQAQKRDIQKSSVFWSVALLLLCYCLLNWELRSTGMFNVLTYGFNDSFMAAQEVCEMQASQKGHWL